MSERLSNRWFAPPRPKLAYDNDVIPARASEPQAATSPANQSSYYDQDLIDRLAADLQIDPATVNGARATGTATQDNGDRAFVESLVAELNDARARIDQLETEAEERLHQARMQIRAEIGAALGRLQDQADANLEAVKQEAEDRAAHRIGVAELRIRRLEGEVAAAKGATERAKSEAEAQIENMKAQAEARARQHAETERRLADVQAEVVQSHSIALQARTDAATLVERTRRETAERIAQITSDFDAQVARMQGELHHYKTRVPDADARVVKVKEQSEQRIARLSAQADERIAKAQADADERIAKAKAETDERLVRASTEIQQTFTRLEGELATARQETEETRAAAEARMDQMVRDMGEHIEREVTKRARDAQAALEHRYARTIAATEDQMARLEEVLDATRQRAERAEQWIARIHHQVEGQMKTPAHNAPRGRS